AVGRVDALGKRRGGGDVVPPPRAHPDLARAVTAVPPDLVAFVALRVGEEVADGEVLDVDAADLERLDAVTAAAGRLLVLCAGRAGLRTALRPVDDHGVAVHPAEVQSRRSDQDTSRFGAAPDPLLVVVAGPDQDPVARPRGIDRSLDRAVLPALPLVGADK